MALSFLKLGLGIGHWGLGIGHWALGIELEKFTPTPLHPYTLTPLKN
ncbi:hypothetical protein [Nostoc sp. CMAA1605]|nr:hypothetical protein [Nostoc sp. CMAA1605]